MKPLSLKIIVSSTAASVGNCSTIFLAGIFFLFSLFSIIDLIQNIFTAGQTVNFIYKKEKLENSQNDSHTA